MNRLPRSSPERRHLTQKAAALLLAASAMTGIFSTASENQTVQKTEIDREHMPVDTAGGRVELDTESSIIIASSGNLSAQMTDSPHQFANESHLRATGQWCEVPSLPLLEAATEETFETAARIPMGYTEAEYEKVLGRLEASADREAAEAIVREEFAHFGIAATFNQIPEGYIAVDTPVDVKRTDDEKHAMFIRDMSQQLRAHRFLPKEMIKIPEKINFIDARAIVKKEGGRGAEGLYHPLQKQITLILSSGMTTYMHESAHALHESACQGVFNGRTDGELLEAHQWALANVADDEVSKWLKANNRYDEQYVQRTGFPTQYSEEDKYFEFFAEKTVELLLSGQSSGDEKAQLPHVKPMEQMVAERLRAAMPTVDIASLLAARNAYRNTGSPYIPLDVLRKYRVSAIDETFASTYWDLNDYGRMEPAIRLAPEGHGEESFIYGYTDLEPSEGEGRAWKYFIKFNKTGDADLDEKLIQRAARFMAQKGESTENIYVEVRELTDIIAIFGRPSDLQGAKLPLGIHRTDFSESVPKGASGG